MHRRALVYALLALAVPLPALALTGRGGGEQPPPDVSLSVAAALDSCGTAANTIVCKIDASWNALPGATRYTASVTRADGSVVDFGSVVAGSASFWVPYVGNGTYTVSVSAYGTPPGEEEPEVLDRDSANAGSGDEAGDGGGEDPALEAPGQDASGADPVDTGEVDSPGQEPSCGEPGEPPEPEEPPVTEPGAGPGADGDAAKAPLSPEAESALDETAELPESVECPDPKATG